MYERNWENVLCDVKNFTNHHMTPVLNNASNFLMVDVAWLPHL